MDKHIAKNLKNGFSLIEIIVVLIVIGVLASMAIPRYGTMLEKARASEGEGMLLALLGSQKRYAQENNGNYSNTLSGLDIEFTSSEFFDPLTNANISSSNPIAEVTRTGSYTLEINDLAIITCTGGPAGLCTKMGY